MNAKYFLLAGLFMAACHTQKQQHQVLEVKTNSHISRLKDRLSSQLIKQQQQFEQTEEHAWIEIIPNGNFHFSVADGYQGKAESIRLHRKIQAQRQLQDSTSKLVQHSTIQLKQDSLQQLVSRNDKAVKR